MLIFFCVLNACVPVAAKGIDRRLNQKIDAKTEIVVKRTVPFSPPFTNANSPPPTHRSCLYTRSVEIQIPNYHPIPSY